MGLANTGSDSDAPQIAFKQLAQRHSSKAEGQMKRNRNRNLKKIIGSVLGAVGMAAVMAFALSGWVKGHVFGLAWQWFGDEQFVCGGDQVVTITGKSLEFDGTIISAGGNCEITLRDCHLKGDKTISVGGSAVLIIEGGTIEGSEVAVSAAGGGLEIRNATLIGGETALKFYGARSNSASVTGTTIEAVGVAVKASHEGTISFSSSNIRGTTAIDASSKSVVVIQESLIEGKVKKGSGATVDL